MTAADRELECSSISGKTIITAKRRNVQQKNPAHFNRIENLSLTASEGKKKTRTDVISACAVMETPLLQSRRKELESLAAFGKESRTLWKIARPAIFTVIAQYSLGALTQTFAGRVGELELAAVSVENSVVAGLAFGVMLGMGSALETLCGQAYGAGQTRMLGIYMQRSWVILLATACLLVPVYVWSPPILIFLGQTSDISHAAGEFAIWMLPQLFAYAMNFPIQKFLQAQSKVKVMAWISAVVLLFHAFFSWLLILKLEWGLVGAAIVLNASWWIIIVAQLAYIFITKSDGAWSGFSWLAFSHLWGFVKLSLASAVMLCLEFWYLMVLVVITGRLPDPLIAVDAISICMNLNGWEAMIALGFNAAISVRVSNELGKGNAGAAKLSVLVVSATSIAIGVVCMILVFTTRGSFPQLFTSSAAVAEETSRLAALLAFTFLLNSLQPVLSGVAIGARWQSLVAYINIGCYYLVGLPAGILLGFTFGYGLEGLWSGMIGGIVLQTIILVIVTAITDWDSEAKKAEGRVKRWEDHRVIKYSVKGYSIIFEYRLGSTFLTKTSIITHMYLVFCVNHQIYNFMNFLSLMV